MKVPISNSLGSVMLKFIEIRDTILAEKINRKDSWKASTSSSTLNTNKGRSLNRNNNWSNKEKSKSNKSLEIVDFSVGNMVR